MAAPSVASQKIKKADTGCIVGKETIPVIQICKHAAEMEKRADSADASVLFFLHSCANFLAVNAQIR